MGRESHQGRTGPRPLKDSHVTTFVSDEARTGGREDTADEDPLRHPATGRSATDGTGFLVSEVLRGPDATCDSGVVD